MARYIDVDNLAEMINARAEMLVEGKEAFFYIADWLNKLPTADVVEVVRCKDCKHAAFYTCKNDACYKGILCQYRIGIGDENFFCSCGERRENENDRT